MSQMTDSDPSHASTSEEDVRGELRLDGAGDPGFLPLERLGLGRGPGEPRTAMPFGLYDGERRSVRYLRLSVTDRCSFRCVYCMPEAGLSFVPRSEVLTFDEITRLVGIFAQLGVTHVRLTGGEPLLRKGLPDLVRRIAAVPGIADLALSTNGVALDRLAAPLAQAGLRRVNVSLDSLDAARFERLTRTPAGTHARVLAGLEAALAAGLAPVKLNAVVLRGENDGELAELVRFAAERGFTLRFIEHMPVEPVENGGFWSRDGSFVPVAEMRATLASRYALTPLPNARGAHGGPARYALATPHDGSHAPVEVGFITAVSDHFCATCNRVRVTAVGTLQECLAFPGHVSLRDAMRAGTNDEGLAAMLHNALFAKGPGHRFGNDEHTFQSMSITGG